MRLSTLFDREFLKFNLRFICASILIGLISVFFVKVVGYAEHLFLTWQQQLGWWLLLYVPSLMLLIVFLLRRFFPEAEGSGLPQVLAIPQLSEASLNYYFKVKAIFSKILLISLGTLAGGTLGREGATVQIGASIMSQVAPEQPLHRKRTMLIVGAAAGLASAFNTPLGGIVFAFEELVRAKSESINILKISGIAISGIIAVSLLSNYSYFGRVDRTLLFYHNQIFIAALSIGLVAGLSSALFTTIIRTLMIDDTPFSRFRSQHPYWTVIISGFIVAAVGIASHGLSFGNGYHESRQALDNQLNLPQSYVIFKMLSAIFTTNSGVPGGYFATSLAIGNGIGGLIHHWLIIGNQQQCYLLGMVAFLAALTRAPATAIVMVVQVSATQVFSLPLIVAALTSAIIANLCGKGVYDHQIAKLIKKSN